MAIGLLLICCPATAQEVEGPHAAVTAISGGGATRGADGTPFSAAQWKYYGDEYALRIGDSIVTAADGTAVLVLPDYETALHLGDAVGPAELAIDDAGESDLRVPLLLNLRQGHLLVARKGAEQRWLLISLGPDGDQGHLLCQGASFVIEATAASSTVSVSSGRILGFVGPPPAEWLDEAGQPSSEAVIVDAGQQRSTTDWQTPRDDTQTVPQAVDRLNDSLYAFALTKGAQWVEKAEQGDLVPARGAIRGAPQVFAGEVGGGRATFDQPRSVVTVVTPRATLTTTRTGLDAAPVVQNIGFSLIQSRVPTSVVVGQRFLRTRIIGNPGTNAGVRANPQAQQLIRLPGR